VSCFAPGLDRMDLSFQTQTWRTHACVPCRDFLETCCKYDGTPRGSDRT
jgi:hypothetical protein